MQNTFDSLISWFYDNGYVDQLALLASNTSGLRSLILSLASLTAGYGITTGSPTETTIAALVMLLAFILNAFVVYARNKFAKELQAAVGAKQDNFIGRETIQKATS